MRYAIRAKKPFRSINRTQGGITINPIKAVNTTPNTLFKGKLVHCEFLPQLKSSKTNEPKILGMASINEKSIAFRLDNPNIRDAVMQIPRRLIPGKIAIA